jgi:nucleoside-diphosphate-sugar epimerase
VNVVPVPESIPEKVTDVDALEELLSRPDALVAQDLAGLDGDIVVLGAGGKIGPTLTRMAKRAAPNKKVTAVARFSEPGLRERLDDCGIETIHCDLLDREQVAALPKARNVVFLAGRKFGSSGDQPLTWAMNVYLPGIVAEAFRGSRIVAFSTGCVYPFVDVTGMGADEETPMAPPGEYANSTVGRERLFEYFSALHGTPGCLFRLNYAIDLRYGVLYDIARTILDGKPVDVSTGHVNVIWQGDANRYALRALAHTTAPTVPINISGPETLSVAWLARELARRLGRPAELACTPAPTAWLTNTARAMRLFGYPQVSIARMLDWTADWVARDMPGLNKPTKFESRDGSY